MTAVMKPEWVAERRLLDAARKMPLDQMQAADPALQVACLVAAAGHYATTMLGEEMRCEQFESRSAAERATRLIGQARKRFVDTACAILGVPAWPPVEASAPAQETADAA